MLPSQSQCVRKIRVAGKVKFAPPWSRPRNKGLQPVHDPNSDRVCEGWHPISGASIVLIFQRESHGLHRQFLHINLANAGHVKILALEVELELRVADS